MINFLSSMPQFGGPTKSLSKKNKVDTNWAWTRGSLAKLAYYFESVSY